MRQEAEAQERADWSVVSAASPSSETSSEISRCSHTWEHLVESLLEPPASPRWLFCTDCVNASFLSSCSSEPSLLLKCGS